MPVTVRDFAARLVAQRCLAQPLDVQPIARHSLEQSMRAGFAELAHVDGFAPFVAWAAAWALDFAERVGAQAVAARLTHARRPMCPRFHTDNVKLRFISTLFGPGSEWLRPEDVGYLENGSICQETAGAVQRMHPASVGFFKGSQGAAGLRGGVAHRSPDVFADRVLLTIDAVSA